MLFLKGYGRGKTPEKNSKSMVTPVKEIIIQWHLLKHSNEDFVQESHEISVGATILESWSEREKLDSRSNTSWANGNA